MAILIPEQSIIDQQKVLPISGEQYLIDFLVKNLNDEYEIYYQPYLNGKNPDVILMRRNGGVLIIEVKDWELSNYYIDNNGRWRLLKNDAYIHSPLLQAEGYKNKIYNLTYRFLYENILNQKTFGVVRTAVYFHNENKENILNFIGERDESKHTYIIGNNDMNIPYWHSLLNESYISKKSKLFSDELYFSIKRYLKPTFHQSEIGREIYYSEEQQKLIVSETGKRQKIKGSAGSGKTLVLAKRAVNAHLRTNNKVLILTFNLSLVNYIHDQISNVRESFAWKNFYITNYHTFFKDHADIYNLDINGYEDYDDEDFFYSERDSIKKYDVILIDEIQDYKQSWLNLIVNYFSHSNTEIVVFGDEKQNIYDRELDENKEIKITGITGKWNKSLNKSFRFNNKIADLAIEFQKEFLNKKYTLDNIVIQQELDLDFPIIDYYQIRFESNEIIGFIFDILNNYEVHSNDVAILSDKVSFLRTVEYCIRELHKEDTMITFETKEEYEGLEKSNKLNQENINKIRRAKKVSFWLNSGTIKLSTVHSFKGWEAHTIFLFVDENSNDELIYTGITRARQNIIVINFGNMKYHEFFIRNMNIIKNEP